MKKIEVAIVGAGSGGLSARREVAKKTNNYLVFDHGDLGTTCARVGCMPSKVFIQVANDFHRRFKLEQEGILGGQGLQVDSKKLMKHVRSLRDRFVRGVLSGMDDWKKNFIPHKAMLLDQNTLMANNEVYHFEKLILATGSKPFTPAVYKNIQDKIITTDSFFELEDLPQKMVIIGIGVIALELGQALTRLGVEVIFLARRKVYAGISDPEINSYIDKKFQKEIKVDFSGVLETKLQNEKAYIKTKQATYKVDLVLTCAGRNAVLKNLGLESIGIENEVRLKRNTFSLEKHPHIFIAGDMTGEKKILHEASDEGRISGYNAVNEMTAFKSRTPLAITFTDPNIAIIGKSYNELEASEISFKTGMVTYEGQGRAIVKLKEIGLMHIYGESKTGKILGAEIFAPEGEHIAHLLSWVIEQDLTVVDVLSFPFYHPVIEEGLRTALRDLKEKCGLETELEIKRI